MRGRTELALELQHARPKREAQVVTRLGVESLGTAPAARLRFVPLHGHRPVLNEL